MHNLLRAHFPPSSDGWRRDSNFGHRSWALGSFGRECSSRRGIPRNTFLSLLPQRGRAADILSLPSLFFFFLHVKSYYPPALLRQSWILCANNSSSCFLGSELSFLFSLNLSSQNPNGKKTTMRRGRRKRRITLLFSSSPIQLRKLDFLFLGGEWNNSAFPPLFSPCVVLPPPSFPTAIF